MNNTNLSGVIDLIGRDDIKPQSVMARIERRLFVLNAWLAEGIPAGKDFPKNLKAVGAWDDDELGIVRIGSPNEITTTHPLHGEKMLEILGLLKDLEKKYARPRKKVAPNRKGAQRDFDRAAFDSAIQAAVDQWHMQRDLHLVEKKRADSATARSQLLRDESEKKDELIADLRRQISAARGPRAAT